MMAVNHQEPDRIPIDLGGHRSSGISAIAYRRLKEHLGIESGDIYVYDVVQQLAVIEPEVEASPSCRRTGVTGYCPTARPARSLRSSSQPR
jgi:hypothetical protein